ncbi:M15 family metallopeptidase [Aquibacillus albus]|uniref:D-alanyl-D-alanine carboxypeptidase n=1 Tax=Aquibacillus albus TaxID=1168171 RepID=A0ABS2MZW0_9BACI|nr:M15 family metallopeptidase [Aquibacillus albus]MBM7571429.1 D-alanyl-D-alanine carboxypeptidase [Aquibacillus albus]
MKFITILILTSFMLIGCQQEPNPTDELKTSEKRLEAKAPIEISEEETDKDEETKTGDNTEEDIQLPEEDKNSNAEMVVVENPNSIEVMVNKQRRLPDGFEPTDLVVPDVPFSFSEDHPKKQMQKEAAKALEEMFDAAEEAQLELVAASGYRAYGTQKAIYEYNVETHGQDYANRFSAKPGTSEHQTGLAMDVTTAEVAFALEQSFSQTDEGEWLEEHAHEFGFIIRYPEGKESITGYSYEPWHLRFIGEEIATEIHENSITLEEFFGYGY